MLRHSFIHTPGVGPHTEVRIWRSGISSWEDFLARPEQVRLSASLCGRLSQHLKDSVEHLERRNHCFFSRCLPPSERWRAFPEFRERIAFLDIETDGGTGPDSVTMVGIHDGDSTRRYIRGRNLARFPQEVRQYALLVTYHGAGFDLPMLRLAFPHLVFDQIHIDLCPLLRRLGYKGGLKGVERQLGIRREPEIAGMDGWDAMRLWQQYQEGSVDALDLLLMYNRADVENLVPLMEFAYRAMWQLRRGAANATGQRKALGGH